MKKTGIGIFAAILGSAVGAAATMYLKNKKS
jgi:hypothetical protein